jgi:hypothetical protein
VFLIGLRRSIEASEAGTLRGTGSSDGGGEMGELQDQRRMRRGKSREKVQRIKEWEKHVYRLSSHSLATNLRTSTTAAAKATLGPGV